MLAFLGIGAQKSGTSWLHAVLSSSSLLRFPLGKEGHFWNRSTDLSRVEIQNYLQHFRDPHLLEGEITPAYSILDAGRIRLLQRRVPGVKLIFLIRNPIERAWSSARMALRRAELEPHEASMCWFLDHFRSRGSLMRGDYEAILQRWQGVFGADAILVLRYEDITIAPQRLLQQVATHLGLDSEAFKAIPETVLRKRVFSGDGVPIPSILHEELEQIYRSRIESLNQFLGAPTGW
jgi:hypothetical protein